MKNINLFWQGVWANTLKAFIFCATVYFANAAMSSSDNIIFLFLLVFVGVVLTGVITSYFWRKIGFSSRQIFFRALLLDWIGTLLYMCLFFPNWGERIGLFIYFTILGFWVFALCILGGILISKLFVKSVY